MDYTVYERVSDKLQKEKLSISFCESCTGGALVSTLVKFPGASNVLSESYVTYSEEAKKKILGVKEETLRKYTVYSSEVAKEMVDGLYNLTKSDICVSITGEVGGDDDQEYTAYVVIKYKNINHEYIFKTKGNRCENINNYVFEIYLNLEKIL